VGKQTILAGLVKIRQNLFGAGMVVFMLGLSLLALSGCVTSSATISATPSEPHLVEIPTDLPTLTPQNGEAEDAPTEIEQTPEKVEEASTSPDVFKIDPEKSEARFYVDEVLFGEPKTVVGRTSDLSGEITVDMDVPAQVELSVIEVNALDLTTDNSFRNRALRQQILESTKDEFQFIRFESFTIEGIPNAIVLGEPIAFQVIGELTIRDITNQVTFEMNVVPVSGTELSGQGFALVQRADFDLTIPKVTGVAEVSEEVRLEIDFVAIASDT
jgi:polyisoprenoid-binding protein YceI